MPFEFIKNFAIELAVHKNRKTIEVWCYLHLIMNNVFGFK